MSGVGLCIRFEDVGELGSSETADRAPCDFVYPSIGEVKSCARSLLVSGRLCRIETRCVFQQLQFNTELYKAHSAPLQRPTSSPNSCLHSTKSSRTPSLHSFVCGSGLASRSVGTFISR